MVGLLDRILRYLSWSCRLLLNVLFQLGGMSVMEWLSCNVSDLSCLRVQRSSEFVGGRGGDVRLCRLTGCWLCGCRNLIVLSSIWLSLNVTVGVVWYLICVPRVQCDKHADASLHGRVTWWWWTVSPFSPIELLLLICSLIKIFLARTDVSLIFYFLFAWSTSLFPKEFP